MTTQTLYLWFPGNATEALKFYHETFGGELILRGCTTTFAHRRVRAGIVA